MCDSCDWETSLDQAKEALDLCEDVPPKYQGMIHRFESQMSGMRDWIEENEHVTDRMQEVIEDMLTKAKGWNF